MKADIHDVFEVWPLVELRLSRRNLQVLLAKLDGHPPGSACKTCRLRRESRNLQVLLAKLDGHPPGSACTLERDDGSGAVFRVIAEEDAEHYRSEERLAG